MTTATKCPHCGKVNKLADAEGFTEGPPEFHAACWAEIQSDARTAGWWAGKLGISSDANPYPMSIEAHRRWEEQRELARRD